MNNNTIPPMTHPLSTVWEQPPVKDILIDDTHAVMRRRTFEALKEYSASQPSGVYEGKMWRRHDGVFDNEFLARGGKPVWKLCWFGFSDNPDMCRTYMRTILLVD